MSYKKELDLLYQGMPDKPDATEGPVAHYHGAGIYCRRAFIAKDQVVRMHVHTYDHLTIVGSGRGRLMREHTLMEVQAGDVIEVKAGQRHAYLASEDTVWLCVHPTEESEAKELYGWRARIANRLRTWFQGMTSAHFLASAAAVVGIASSAKSLFGGKGKEREQAGKEQANWDFEEAGRDRALADRERASGTDWWSRAGGTAEKGQEYYNVLADFGREQLNVWRNEGLPILRELGLHMVDSTNRQDEETDWAANQVKQQYGLKRADLQRATEFARNPSDPGYADILRDSYGREAADTANAITVTRRAERDRLANIERENFQRKQAIANMYGTFAQQGAANLGNAGAGSDRTAAVYGSAAGARDASANTAAQRAIVLSGASYNAREKGLQAADEANGQLGYGGAMLAKNADRWFGGINPKTGQPANNTVNGSWDVDPGMQSSYDQNAEMGLPYAEGGKVEGPGTGTSDSVGAIKKPGTYILSADTVRALGTKKLHDMMDKAGVKPGYGGSDNDKGGVPVRLSNGEWSMPPEVTKYYGEEFFNKLQQKHHRPVFSEDQASMANGGAIRKRALPSSVEDAIFAGMPRRAISRRG